MDTFEDARAEASVDAEASMRELRLGRKVAPFVVLLADLLDAGVVKENGDDDDDDWFFEPFVRLSGPKGDDTSVLWLC